MTPLTVWLVYAAIVQCCLHNIIYNCSDRSLTVVMERDREGQIDKVP